MKLTDTMVDIVKMMMFQLSSVLQIFFLYSSFPPIIPRPVLDSMQNIHSLLIVSSSNNLAIM